MSDDLFKLVKAAVIGLFVLFLSVIGGALVGSFFHDHDLGLVVSIGFGLIGGISAGNIFMILLDD